MYYLRTLAHTQRTLQRYGKVVCQLDNKNVSKKQSLQHSEIRRRVGPWKFKDVSEICRYLLTGEWMQQHNEELNDLYSSPNIVREMKSKRMRWVVMQHVWGRGEVYTGCWWRNRRERDHLGDTGLDGRIMLRWIFRNWDMGAWTEQIWLRLGKCGNEPQGFIKCGEFLDYQRTVWLLKKDLLHGVYK